MFGREVGIVTGDVSINKEEAWCLVMTTEVLRSMIYKQDEMLNDVEWVIFDEVHYINDAERGVVWEETIINLPPRIKIVMLSATVPNFLEFAQWVGKVKSRTVCVEYTQNRPVPLEYSVYMSGQFV
jgi:antiviral helicase SKI2